MGWNDNRNYSGYRKYNNKAARLSFLVCSLMFVIFAAVYLGVMQRDLLEAIHLSMSKEPSTFQVVPATITLIVILIILKLSLNLVMRLRGAAHVLAYVPSFMGLVTMTAFGRDVYMKEFSYQWWWIMPVFTVVYVGIVVAVKRYAGKTTYRHDLMETVIWNVAIMLLLSVGTLCLGNTDRYLHNELRMENLMDDGRNSEALRVAEKSLRTTRTMTALRMMAMTKEGKTGELIFRYPQYYKEDGLFFDTDSAKTLRYTNDSVYAMLGEAPETGETKMEFLKRIAENNDSCRMARDYYMAGLMLEKNLEGLAKELDIYVNRGDSLQRYMKEAAVMYKEKNPKWTTDIQDNDSAYTRRRMEYVEKQNAKYKSDMEERNKMRLEFGDTFWWYYDYQE